MDFPIDVKPDHRIQITSHNSVKSLLVQPDPLDHDEPYFEYGGTGAVLQLRDTNSDHLYALKIFDKRYQDSGQVQYAENLTRLQLHNFISVADRTVITPQSHPHLIDQYGALKYSLFMPWIPGFTWQEVLIENKGRRKRPPFTPSQCFMFGARLCVLLKSLEDKNCAHCDVCSNNVIVDPRTNRVELIDIEDMYGPYFTKSPGFIGGQKGYTHQKHDQEHQWCQESDRFGGAILLAEMLTWYSQSIRDMSGSESYFSSNDELHKKSVAFQTLLGVLKEQTNQRIADLFEATWQSTHLRECPRISDWYREIAKVASEKNINVEGLLVGDSAPTQPLVKSRRIATDNSGTPLQPVKVPSVNRSIPDVSQRASAETNLDTQPIAPKSTHSLSSPISNRRNITMDTDSIEPAGNSLTNKTITPRNDSIPSASSPKPRVTPPTSNRDITSKDSTDGNFESLSTIFWTVVAVLAILVVLNFVFPELFPSIIQFIQGLVDKL